MTHHHHHQKYEFIQETSNYHQIKLFVFFLFVVGGLAGLWYIGTHALEQAVGEQGIDKITAFFKEDLTNLTPTGIFYWSLLGGLFFFPVPIELFFIKSLANGHGWMITTSLLMFGWIIAQIFDYYVGKKFSRSILQFISKKKVFKTKRWINRYGSYAIFAFNVLPLPSPLVTFALGIARYNVARLFTLTIAGTLLKYLTIVWFVSYF